MGLLLVGLFSWPSAVSNLCPVSALWSPESKEMQDGGIRTGAEKGERIFGMNRAELDVAGAEPEGLAGHRSGGCGACPGIWEQGVCPSSAAVPAGLCAGEGWAF